MFERFTGDAREAVRRAVQVAERRRSPVIGPEHLLLALVDEASPAAAGLAAAGLTPAAADELLAELALVARRGGLDAADAAALRSIGIDLDAIVAELEGEHGAGVLVPPAPRGPASRLLGRRVPRSHRPFTTEAKKVLERTLRVALAAGDRDLTTRHIAIALATGDDAVAQGLAARGVTPETLRAHLPESP